jgi:hypothetical protein
VARVCFREKSGCGVLWCGCAAQSFARALTSGTGADERCTEQSVTSALGKEDLIYPACQDGPYGLTRDNRSLLSLPRAAQSNKSKIYFLCVCFSGSLSGLYQWRTQTPQDPSHTHHTSLPGVRLRFAAPVLRFLHRHSGLVPLAQARSRGLAKQVQVGQGCHCEDSAPQRQHQDGMYLCAFNRKKFMSQRLVPMILLTLGF